MSENPDIEFFDAEIANLIHNNFSGIIAIHEQDLKDNGEYEDEDTSKEHGIKDGAQIHSKDKDDKEEIFVPWKEPEPGTEEYKKQQQAAKHLDVLAMIEQNKKLIEDAKASGKELSLE